SDGVGFERRVLRSAAQRSTWRAYFVEKLCLFGGLSADSISLGGGDIDRDVETEAGSTSGAVLRVFD
ncbi:hypothetical protein R3X27_12815, partial [Tropicimonas sp. TH_r6]|uniref:hypothetical protein n=1 Tax=Tropicimonas sp. TH_r6 TaxID=3082085 RepID=UPI0029543A65